MSSIADRTGHCPVCGHLRRPLLEEDGTVRTHYLDGARCNASSRTLDEVQGR